MRSVEGASHLYNSQKKDWTKDWQSRIERLTNQAWALRNEILSGQLALPVEKTEGAA